MKEIVSKLWEMFIKYDCLMIELNPLIEDHKGESKTSSTSTVSQNRSH